MNSKHNQEKWARERERLVQELQSLRDHLESTQAERDVATSESERLRVENDALRMRFERVHAESLQFRTERDRLQTKLDEACSQLDTSRAECDRLQRKATLQKAGDSDPTALKLEQARIRRNTLELELRTCREQLTQAIEELALLKKDRDELLRMTTNLHDGSRDLFFTLHETRVELARHYGGAIPTGLVTAPRRGLLEINTHLWERHIGKYGQLLISTLESAAALRR